MLFRSVLISGAAGVGKSWIACALGNQAARDGVSVLYKRLSRLLDELAIARLHGRQARLLKTLARTRLLILDDWAMVKLTADQRRDLMEVIDDRHDRGSTIVATQIPRTAGTFRLGIRHTPTRSWIVSSTTHIASSSRASRCAATAPVGRWRIRLEMK